MPILADSIIKLTMLIWEDAPVIIAETIPPYKRLQVFAVILRDAVVLPGVVGVLQKDMIWLTSGIN